VNGFMGVATNTEDYGIIVSTSGTLDSEYAGLACRQLNKGKLRHMVKGYTYLFEICDPTDPHIVPEVEGAYLVGIRNIATGILATETQLDKIANLLEYSRPLVNTLRFGELKEVMKETTHEGFMVREASTGETLAKWKSPYYLSAKALMRVGKARISVLFDTPEVFKERLDEEFYGLVDYITISYTRSAWESYGEQERRLVIEEYYGGENVIYS